MKKIFTLLSVFIAITAVAQVSTTPMNKKVVLEEFTGQTCQYCPDGHKIGNELAAANEGNIFLINIHSGGYATPSASYPLDLRTTNGTTIDAASGITGYPAGSVNRRMTPWASNRGAWASEAATIMGESSPVNVWCTSTVDKDTRMLKTDVEVYYTANGTGTSNKLTVAVLQDGILGDQVGGTTWNPTNYVNGKYIHNHVLRLHQTPTAWGASLDTLTSGKLYKRTYYTVLPATVGNIPLDIYNLKVVAFVAEANNKILSGHEVAVTHNNPNIVDLSLKDSSVLPMPEILGPTHWCDKQVQPRVRVTNNSTLTVTSFTCVATINGVATPKTYTGSLANGASAILDWGTVNVTPEGYYSFSISGFTNINNSGTTITDSKALNNSYLTTLFGFKDNAFISLLQGFDSTTMKHTVLDQSENAQFSIVTSATTNLGADNTKNAVRFSLHSSWGVANKPGHIMMGTADLRNAVTPKLKYKYAYSDGSNGGTAPTIQASYSLDCGASWTNVGTAKTCLQTGQPAVTTSFYVPTSAQYDSSEVDLTPLIGKSCLLRLSGTPGQGGNALYIDQINLTNAGTGGASALDSFHAKVNNVVNATVTSVDIVGGTTLTKDSMYTWKISSVSTMPTGWSLKTICDPVDCVNYPTVQRNTYKAKGNPTLDIFKVTIDHGKKAGYAFTILKNWKGKDSVAGAKEYKFSLLANAGASIGIVSDVNDKLLYYFDNKLFVDRDFKNAQLQVVDINGKEIMDSKVSNDNIDFMPLTNGIYIARIIKDGQVQKTLKFSTAR